MHSILDYSLFNTKLCKMRIKKLILSLVIAAIYAVPAKTQDVPKNEQEYDSLYAINIRMSKINGVYIPRDLEEAHSQVMKLSPSESLRKFAAAPEKEVSEKLHFGIGRWMIINWNFYEGSRLSHYLKQKGLLHPDDMAQFILRTLHRKMNNKPPGMKSLIEELEVARKKEIEEVYKN